MLKTVLMYTFTTVMSHKNINIVEQNKLQVMFLWHSGK